MVPVPLLPTKRPVDAGKTLGSTSAAIVWITPYAFIIPCMLLVGVARIVAPKGKDDFDRYLTRLATLLEKSLESAVAYREAGATKERPSVPPARTRTATRPGGTTRPGQKPGAPRSRRRSRTRR